MSIEMISLKSPREIEAMRKAGRLTAQARALAGSMVRPGVTTKEIDTAVRRFIESHGAKPSFLGYGGYPGSACISVNDEIIHGIPGPRKLKEGDIVSVDVGAYIGGFHGDCAATYACGQISAEAQKLIDVTQQSFFEGIKMARQGCRVSDIGHAVQTYVEANGFSVVRDYVGHGVGAKLHEAPEVRNYGAPGHGPRLQAGGKRRKMAAPKRKKLRHAEILVRDPQEFDHPVLEKLRQTQSATDRELRRALAAFKGR